MHDIIYVYCIVLGLYEHNLLPYQRTIQCPVIIILNGIIIVLRFLLSVCLCVTKGHRKSLDLELNLQLAWDTGGWRLWRGCRCARRAWH